MNNNIIKELLKEYEQKRLKEELDLEKKLNDFYLKNPDLASINQKLIRLPLKYQRLFYMENPLIPCNYNYNS